MTRLSNFKNTVAPIALGLALISVPSFAQDAEEGTEEEAGESIVVTGSRIVSPNLTAVAPVTAVSAQDIKLSGTGNTEDILNSLPQVFAAQSSTISNGATGTATVDLRGLGTSRTLVLINGRRLMSGDPNSTSSAADLNFIPATLVKRIDVLTGGASATYGADAVAGVVNFIMDKDFEGFRLDGNYSFYNHNNRNKITPPILDARIASGLRGYSYPTGSTNDGADFDATVSFGGKFGDDKGHFMAYAGYRKAKPVLQSNRDYSACTVQLTGGAIAAGAPGNPTGSAILNPAAPLQCGGSATSDTGNALIFDGGSSSSTFGALGPGTFAVGPATRYNFAPLNYFQRPDERYTAGAFVDYEINDAIKPYLEFMFMDDRTLAQIAPSGDFGNTLTINCDNPLLSAAQRATICQTGNLINGFIGTFPTATSAGYNPNPANPAVNFIDPTTGATYNRAFFQLLRRNVEGGPRISDLQHTAFRTIIGTKGELGKAWNYDAYYQFGRTNYSQVYSNEFSVDRLNKALDVIDDPRVAGVQAICRSALAGTDPNCRPYDVFGGTPSAASIAYLSATGFLKGNTQQQVFSATLSGLLGEYGVKMPWATDGASIAVGLEHRKESLDLQADNAFQTGDLTGQGAPTLPVSGGYNVSEILGEVEIPIVQDSFFHNLSFNGGFRYSKYSVSNGRKFNTSTYKLGLDFTPIRDIRFRAAYNRAVRAPNIQELFATQFVGLDGSTDPCSGAPIAATNFGCRAQGLSVGQTVTANPAGQYNGLLGGNQNLLPERGVTKTLGVVLQPSFVPGFSLSVDWFDISLKDAIQGFGADAILNSCVSNTTATSVDPACSLIRRDAAGSLWLTSNGFVIDTPTNVGGLSTRGIEFNGAYSREIEGVGALSFSLVGTLLDKYETDNGLTEKYDCVGLYGPTCGGPAPKWRHKARVSLNTGGIGASLQWRYFGPVKTEYTSASSTLAGNFYDFNSKVKAQSYFDLSFTGKFADHFSWILGTNNLLDKEPPIFHSGSGRFGQSNCGATTCNGNTYPGTYDALGRYLYTGITLDF
jgi:iron complex outermembrane recepter protein